MIHLDFQVATDEVDEADLPTYEQCLEWVDAALLEDWGMGETELTIRLVDQDEIQQLNRDYRDKDNPTNVLSFPFEIRQAWWIWVKSYLIWGIWSSVPRWWKRKRPSRTNPFWRTGTHDCPRLLAFARHGPSG